MMDKEFDEIDLYIIGCLAANGRLSGEEIARSLTISNGACRFRMRRLLRSDVSVRTFVNPSKVGFPVTAFLGFKVEPAKINAVTVQLAAHERVSYASTSTGMFDVITLAVFRSVRDITAVMQEFSEQIDGVKDIHAIVCLYTPLGYFFNLSPDSLRHSGGDAHTEIDDVDLRIIGCLADNGRLNTRQVARMLSIGEAAVRRRLKRLLDDRIISVNAVVDPRRIGYSIIAMQALKVELPKIWDITRKLADHRQMNYVTTCAGIFDVLTVGMFRSTSDLQQTLQDFVSRIDGVKEMQTFISFFGSEDVLLPQFVPRTLLPPASEFLRSR